MADIRPTIKRALSTPLAASGSFEREERELLWSRCRVLFLTGLAISLVALGVSLVLPSSDPPLISGPLRFEFILGVPAHALSFGLAVGALYLVRDSRRFLGTIAFVTTAFNLALAIASHAVSYPGTDPVFGVSLILFLTAAFLPWPTRNQVALGALVTIWYPALQLLLWTSLPEARTFWAEQGGAGEFRHHLISGVIGMAILGGASAVVSQTLYSLRRTAFKAERLGNYVIHKELASGGMGHVFLAQHALLCRPTAVKLMRANDREQETALARFEREIRVSATLTHPNTITIYDVGRTPDRSVYYAMEYLEGLDLQQLVERFGPVEPARMIYLLEQVCGSLSEAHSRNIIHRDIKPSNIFLTRRGDVYDFVKVLDFGLAKQIEDGGAPTITKSGVLFGTPRYVAPEMVYGNEKVDGRADIYCLGAVGYWMLTGRPPFTSESSFEVMIDHVKTAPKRLSEVSELEFPAALEDIIMRCLEKRPVDRFQRARDLEAALEAVPLEDPWSRVKAEAWWELHGILGERPLDCECFFPDDEVLEDEPPLVTIKATV